MKTNLLSLPVLVLAISPISSALAGTPSAASNGVFAAGSAEALPGNGTNPWDTLASRGTGPLFFPAPNQSINMSGNSSALGAPPSFAFGGGGFFFGGGGGGAGGGGGGGGGSGGGGGGSGGGGSSSANNPNSTQNTIVPSNYESPYCPPVADPAPAAVGVPDGGSSVVLGAMAMAALAFFRRTVRR